MIDTEALRIKVLDLAFHGTLIHQVKDDRSVDVLYRDVRKKKEALIASKVIKAERKVSNIAEDEMPDDIPATWKYVPFEHVIYEIGNKTNQVKESELTTKGKVPAISQSANFIEGYSDAETKVINNIPLVMFGDHTRNVKYIDFPFVICADGCKFFKTIGIDTKYFYFWLRYAASKIDNKGYARHYSLLRKQLFPLAPLKEERRIVESVESCFEVLNEIDELQQQYANNITSLNRNILDLAIMGKLVPQDPNDEPASVLLKKIAEEKQKLIKKGKIKRDKNESSIIFQASKWFEVRGNTTTNISDEISYELPNGWHWTRLREIGDWGSGATPSRSKPGYYGGNIPWLKTGDLTDGLITHIPETITEEALAETSVRLNPEGSVLIAMYGATIGKLGILTYPATTNQACCACLPLNGIYNRYLFYFLMAHKKVFIEQGAGGAQPNISKEKIVNTLMPIPPINEQYRIVSALDKILPLTADLNG